MLLSTTVDRRQDDFFPIRKTIDRVYVDLSHFSLSRSTVGLCCVQVSKIRWKHLSLSFVIFLLDVTFLDQSWSLKDHKYNHDLYDISTLLYCTLSSV